MLTLFQTDSSHYLFEAPMVKCPRGVPGSDFLGALGAAFDAEECFIRTRILSQAGDLNISLNNGAVPATKATKKLTAELQRLIEYLKTVNVPSVRLNSYDRRPTVPQLLGSFHDGGGGADWALEELGKRGAKARKALLKVLQDDENRSQVLSTVAILLTLFPDDHVIQKIRDYIASCEDEFGRELAVLLAAYA